MLGLSRLSNHNRERSGGFFWVGAMTVSLLLDNSYIGLRSRREFRIGAGLAQRIDDPIRCQWCLREANAAWRARVLDGGDDRGRRRDGSAFAGAPPAQRVEPVRRLD